MAYSPTSEGRNYRPFGTVLRDLLIEREITTKLGNPDWAGFAKTLRDMHYETLRKAVAGERTVAPKVIAAVAKRLNLDPTLFAEYRLSQVRSEFDPGAVGIERALRNLERWETDS
jgi:hypothetical protein